MASNDEYQQRMANESAYERQYKFMKSIGYSPKGGYSSLWTNGKQEIEVILINNTIIINLEHNKI